MDKMLNAGDYTLMFSDPDMIMCGSVDGNQFAYMDDAEEFAKSFFSKGIKRESYRSLTKEEKWLMGALYHENKNSIPEVEKLTGYKNRRLICTVIRSFGPLRSTGEAQDIAFMKKYGKNMPAAMHDIMLEHSDYMRDVMRRRWEEDRKNEKHPLRESIRTGKKIRRTISIEQH